MNEMTEINLSYSDYIEVMMRGNGIYRFVFSKQHRMTKEVKSIKSTFVDLKLNEMPDNLRARINMLRMRPGNSYLEELGAISENWMCVRIEKEEVQRLHALNTGHGTSVNNVSI